MLSWKYFSRGICKSRRGRLRPGYARSSRNRPDRTLRCPSPPPTHLQAPPQLSHSNDPLLIISDDDDDDDERTAAVVVSRIGDVHRAALDRHARAGRAIAAVAALHRVSLGSRPRFMGVRHRVDIQNHRHHHHVSLCAFDAPCACP